MIKKFLYTILICCLCIFNVHATEETLVGESATVTENIVGGTEKTWYYKINVNGEKYDALCQDYLESSGLDKGFYIERMLGDTVDKYGNQINDSILAYDEALLAIFSYFISKENTIDNYNLQATTTRMMTALFQYGINSDTDSSSTNRELFSNLAFELINDSSELYTKYEKAYNLLGIDSKGKDYLLSIDTAGTNTFVGNGSSNTTELKKILIKAFDAIIIFLENGSSNENEIKLEMNTKVVTDYMDATKYITELTTLEKIEGITYDSNSKIEIEYTKSSGITFKCKIDGKTAACPTSSSLSEFEKIEIYAYSEISDNLIFFEDCVSDYYEITYTISDINIKGKAYVAWNSADETTATYQRFIFYVPDAKATYGTGVRYLNNCDFDCEPEYKLVTDCDDGTEGENTWYTSEYTASTNILGCVINGKDEAGSTLVAASCTYENGESNGMENVEFTNGEATNPYCTVSCTESYEKLAFSGAQTTDSGRYFKIGAEISGTKTCYTSQIDYAQFADDIIAAQEEMIKYKNAYESYSLSLSNIYTNNNLSCNSVCSSSDRTGYFAGRDSKTNESIYYNEYIEGTYDSDTGEYKSSVVPTTSEKVYYEDNTGSIGGTKTVNGEPVCSTKCSDGSLSNLKTSVSDKIKVAKENLEDAQEKYNEAIANLTACSNNSSITSNFYNVFNQSNDDEVFNDIWGMQFPIDPIIEYSFENNSYEKKYLDSVNESDKLLNSTTTTTDYDYIYYSCSNYASSGQCLEMKETSNTTTTIKFVYCTESNCDVVSYYDFPSDEVVFVSKTIKKEIEYTIPDDIWYTTHPDGNMIYVNSDEYKALTDSTEVSLIPGQPVSLNTSSGVYDFTFTITDLGEYYDDCTGGRINKELETITKDEENSDDFGSTSGTNFYMNYICYYKVNCPECPIYVPVDLLTIPCTTCIVDGLLNFYFRPISTNNSGTSDYFDYLDRDELGYNWDYKTTDTKYELVQSKAETTLEEIYSDGDSIYSLDPILEVNLTPSLAKKIRDLNEGYATYSEDTISCEDYTVSGVTFANVFCYSEIMNYWIEEYSENFNFIADRDDTTEYFNVITGYDFTKIETNYTIGGPSWK